MINKEEMELSQRAYETCAWETTSEVNDDPISLCENCWCMTHTIDGRCGKCKAKKEINGNNYS